MRRILEATTLFCLAALPSCGPSSRHTTSRPSEAEMRTLDEHRALVIIGEVIADEGLTRGAAWTVDIGEGTELPVDVRVASSAFGIEWMSPQDRADLGDAVPTPTDSGQLRIVPGVGGDAQVLVLEHTSYEFANEREHVQSGVSSAGDAEARLRQDVRDFLHYARGQGLQ